MNQTDQNLPALIVQVILAIIMLAVAFEITLADIKALPKMWRKLLLGYVMQITFLPAFMLLVLMFINPKINLVLAFLLLSSCPGGNLSQLFVIRSKGNIGISMGLSFLSTLFSPLTVAGIFFLATHANSTWTRAYKDLELPWGNIFNTLLTSLFIPLVIGIWMSAQAGAGWTRVRELIQKSVPWLLISLLAGACWSFRESLSGIDTTMLLMVFGISLGCFIAAYFFTFLVTRDYSTSVTIAWEVSIQNSGLGMVLGLVYFAHIPEVSLVCALWGIWQMAMGVMVSGIIGKYIAVAK
jgi:BASS family bile acid:Na+ symporter